MKMLFRFLIASLAMYVFAFSAYALPLNRMFQDLKLPTQAMIERQEILNPIVATTNYVLASHAGPTSAAALTKTTGLTNPDLPRNLTITPGGTTADVAGCTVTVSGTNFFNTAITETFVIADNQSSATTGNKAFKTITSVAWPINCEEGGFDATWIIGIGEKLGAKRCMDYAGNLAWSTVSGAYEATRPTVAADADEVEKNTFDFNGTMDGSADFQAFFVQNFRCFP